MSFSALLIQTCTIQEKQISQVTYEKSIAWIDVSTNVPCRKEASQSVRINDADFRSNTDDDVFYFNADVIIERGNRIILNAKYYDVIKVNEILDSTSLHHIEAVARLVDNK